MTLEERTVAANSEMKEIWLWFNAERKRVYAELNTKLGANRKFNDGNGNYTEMYEELARRCLKVQRKYGLPLDTKLKIGGESYVQLYAST